MKTLIPTVLLLVGAMILLRRSSKRRRADGASRFEPKARSKWNSLNDGEDPTL